MVGSGVIMASVWRATGGAVGAQQILAGGLGRSLTSWLDYTWNLEGPSGYKSGKQSLDDGSSFQSRVRIAASGRLRPESGAPTSGVYLGFSIPIVRKGIKSPPSGHHIGLPSVLVALLVTRSTISTVKALSGPVAGTVRGADKICEAASCQTPFSQSGIDLDLGGSQEDGWPRPPSQK
ncbi:unnamed protein product [Phytophthora fragariaefolia]|uniref:Unnamed protein product n=1 Tax=Phytophthora fragariaefolia TaxID=1490495 RepID=A0A9W6YCD2_9STRA|nr:unnamed protein product [Phytophthora fragariaefolia]